MLKSAAIPIGHISLLMKLTRKPSSGNPNAGFDVAGAGNVLRWFSGAPVSDPTLGVTSENNLSKINKFIKNY